MAHSAARPRPKAGTKAGRRRHYHHGDLRPALIEATLQLIEEEGPEKVTVRAAAKRAGVSSGAPFRHFPNRTALMTAVAEEATARFVAEIAAAQAEVESDDPLARLLAIGTAYLRWAVRNPTHFQVVSTRSLIDYDSSQSLRRDNDAIRQEMEALLAEAQRRGQLRQADIAHAPLAARAMVYGLARMYADGHFAQWAVPGETPEQAMQAVLALFIAGL